MSFLSSVFGSLFSKPKPSFQAPPPQDSSAEIAAKSQAEADKNKRRQLAKAKHSGTNLTEGKLAGEEETNQKKTLLGGGAGLYA